MQALNSLRSLFSPQKPAVPEQTQSIDKYANQAEEFVAYCGKMLGGTHEIKFEYRFKNYDPKTDTKSGPLTAIRVRIVPDEKGFIQNKEDCEDFLEGIKRLVGEQSAGLISQAYVAQRGGQPHYFFDLDLAVLKDLSMNALIVSLENSIKCVTSPDTVHHGVEVIALDNVDGVCDQKKMSYSVAIFDAVKRGDNDLVKIEIPYAQYEDTYKLTDKSSLRNLFRDANETSINIPYPFKGSSHQMKTENGTVLQRPNHNGSHSVRKTKCLDAVFQCIGSNGTEEAKSIKESYTEQEMLCLEMAAFFSRSGRVDESTRSNPASDKNGLKRSAEIFRRYAEQTDLPRDLIEWTVRLIENCGNAPKDWQNIDIGDKKSVMGLQILTSVHYFDLYRCFDKPLMDKMETEIKDFLSPYLDQTAILSLIQYSKNLLIATGSSPDPQRTWSYTSSLYEACSNDALRCFEEADKVQLTVIS